MAKNACRAQPFALTLGFGVGDAGWSGGTRWKLRFLVARSKPARRAWGSLAVKGAWRAMKAHGPRAASALAGVVALVLAFGLIEQDRHDVERVLAGAGIGFVGLMLLATDVLDLSRRLTKLSIGGFGFEIEARSAAEGTASEDPLEQEVRPDDLLDLRHLLEAKLAYLCKHVLPPRPTQEGTNSVFANFGSLAYDNYLTRDQARTASRLLVLAVVGPGALETSTRSAFFKDARSFVDGFRAVVFAAHVRKQVEEAGFDIMRVFPEDDRRRDFLVTKGSDIHLVVPVFATDENSDILKRAKERLDKKETKTAGAGKRIAVVPDVSGAAQATDGEVLVCKLANLLEGPLTS